MRILKASGGFLVALCVLAGCDTEQPVQTGTQNASLDFASYTTGNLVDVWDTYRDIDGDGVRDLGEPFAGVHCGDLYDPPTGPRGEPLQFAALWGFTAEVKVIRAGQVTSTYLIPTSAASDFTNFPTWQDDLTVFPADPPFPDPPPGFDPQFVYVNPRRMINTNSVVLACVTATLPRPNLAGSGLPFQFTVEPGDTLVVSAGRDPSPLLSLWAATPGSFDAVLRINGQVVPVVGSTTTSASNGVLSFSYQLR